MEIKSEKYLVLGGAGFIGSHFCDRLIDNHQIICIDNLSLGSIKNIEHLINNDNFQFHNLDINSEEFFTLLNNEKIDTVIHLAANSDIALSYKNPKIDFDNTLNTTINALKLMRLNDIKKIIFSSSSAIYGEHDIKISEDIGPLLPHSHYGAAKLASEAFISSFCENYNLQSWIIRFPNIIGERSTHGVIHDFFKKIKKDKTQLTVLGDGLQEKPYLYVKELIDGILYCYHNSNNKINYFNLGTESSTSVNDIIKIMNNILNINPKIKYTGGSKGWVGDIPKFKYDLSKVQNLGWKSTMTSNEAVDTTFKLLKDQWMH